MWWLPSVRSIPAAEAYLRPSKTISLLCSLFGKSAGSTRDKIGNPREYPRALFSANFIF